MLVLLFESFDGLFLLADVLNSVGGVGLPVDGVGLLEVDLLYLFHLVIVVNIVISLSSKLHMSISTTLLILYLFSVSILYYIPVYHFDSLFPNDDRNDPVAIKSPDNCRSRWDTPTRPLASRPAYPAVLWGSSTEEEPSSPWTSRVALSS